MGKKKTVHDKMAETEIPGWLAIVTILVFTGGLIGIFVFTDGPGHDTSGSPSSTASGDVHGAWTYMQIYVERQLKNPKDAEFPFGGYRDVTALGGDRYRVDSYVDATNSFGATIRTHFEGVIKRIDGGWEVESFKFVE